MTDVGSTPRKPMSPMRRLKIWEAGKGVCILCERKIRAGEAWIVEHPIALGLGGSDRDEDLGPAHEDCRRAKDKVDVARIAKAKRQKIKHVDRRRSPNPMPGSKASPWKKCMDGRTVRR
jgi:5-methylcytosine-specific restriction protein A